MTRMATSFSLVKPSLMANGKNSAGSTTSLIRDATAVGFICFNALRPSKPAPRPISASGEARVPMLLMVLDIITGKEIRQSEAAMPNKIPMIIGLVRIPRKDFLRAALSSRLPESEAFGPVKDRISTAAILYKGTVPMIIRGGHTGIAVNILNEGNAQNGGTASVGSLDKLAQVGFITVKKSCCKPDDGDAQERHCKTIDHIAGVPYTVKIRPGDVLEQEDRQGYFKIKRIKSLYKRLIHDVKYF